MTELSFAVGQRVTIDLRDSAGTVVVKDWDEPGMRVATEAGSSPFILRDQDTFRIRLDSGGTITLPAGTPAEMLVPPAVSLRLLRDTRGGGETVVQAVAAPEESKPAGDAAEGAADAGVPDLAEFARTMSERGRHIFEEMTRAVRASGVITDEVARRMEEAAERIDEGIRRAAERVQHEAERIAESAERAGDKARRAAERAEEHARRARERAEGHARRAAERTATHARRGWGVGPAGPADWARVGIHLGRAAGRASRAGRGRWWFTEGLDDLYGNQAAGPETTPSSTREERLAILNMLQEGKITVADAARLLEALGS